MADVYEKDLTAKTSLTMSDFIRVVGSDNVSYKQNVNNVNRTIPLTLVSGLTTEALIDQAYITAHDETPDQTPYRRIMNHGMGHSILGGGRFYLEGYRENTNYGWQKVTSYGNPTKMYSRSLNNGTWTTWAKEPTRAEVDALNNALAWNTPPSTVTSLAELQAYIDGLYSSNATGVRFGYIPNAVATACGLSGSHYFQTLSNSANYRIIVVYSVNGDRFRMCGKNNGTWATAWKYISLN